MTVGSEPTDGELRNVRRWNGLIVAFFVACGHSLRPSDAMLTDVPRHEVSGDVPADLRPAEPTPLPASLVPPSGWTWTLRVIDAESGVAIEWVDIEFARTTRPEPNARDERPARISGPTASGWIPVCANSQWSYRVRSPGYAPTYGRFEPDAPSQTRTTVRLQRAANIVGRVSFDGERRAGLRVSCWLDDDGFGGVIYPEQVHFDSRLAESFFAENHETTSSASGAFELTGLRQGSYQVRIFTASETAEQRLHVSLRAGTSKDIGEIHLESKAK